MKLEQERLDDFQARMSEWVSKQGLIFQLRYAGSVKGAKNSAMATTGRLMLRLLVLVVLVGLAFWVYLIKRVDTETFRDGLKSSVAEALHAETIQLIGVQRERGFLQIAAVNVIGDEESIFEDVELRDMKTLMGLGDGLITPWTGDSLQIGMMRAYLKGGANSDEDAAKAFDSLFWRSNKFKLRIINVADTNLKWGYSASNSGQIVGAKMLAKRTAAGWTLELRGGEFSQNWLKRLEIERIEVELTREGIQIHEARFRNRGAEVAFTLGLVKGGATPDFEGKGTFKNLPIADYIGGQYLSVVDGRISGEFEVTGSTNRQTGFRIVADVDLQEGDRIELRDRIPLFRAISTADRFRSYKRVRFTTGTFRMITGSEVLSIENLALVASRLMRLEGSFLVRPPGEGEVAEKLDLNQRNAVALLSEEAAGNLENDFAFTLRKAGESGAKKDEDGGNEESLLLDKRYGSEIGLDLAAGAREREFEKVFLDGKVRLGIVEASLERSPRLAAAFPVDEETDLRWLDLEWQGASPFEIGESLAKRIFGLLGDENN